MRALRATGRNAAALKYDLLTALGVHGCTGDSHRQRRVLRLMTLIVARYNWQSDELAVGQREIAALWSVDERTVKREMAYLRDLGWLVVRRPAARGRVAVHGLDIGAILDASAPDWARVGPDFADRMAAPADGTQSATGNVISFPAPPRDASGALWPRVQEVLHRQNPAVFAAWFAPLQEEDGPPGRLRLRAPSRFHAAFVTTHHMPALMTAIMACVPGIDGVEIQA